MNRQTVFALTTVLLVIIAVFAWYRTLDRAQSNSDTPTARQDYTTPDGWRTFNDALFGYSLALPPTVVLRESDTDTNRFAPIDAESSPVGLTRFLAVSAFYTSGEASYNQNLLNTLTSLELGNTSAVKDGAPGQEEWFTYTRTADLVANGNTFLTFENSKPWEKPEGTKEYVYLLTSEEKNYLISAYAQAAEIPDWDKDTFDMIVSSFMVPSEVFACTEDAKICADGTSVGRTGNKCAFQVCSYSPLDTQNWQLVDSNEYFRVRVPTNWEVSTMEDNNGAMQITRIEGPEGWVQFSTGVGFGGSCDANWTQVQTLNRLLIGCEVRNTNGDTIISQISTELVPKDGQGQSFDGVIQINGSTETATNTLNTILATLDFK